MLFWGGSPVGYLENLWNALDFGSLWDLLLTTAKARSRSRQR